MLYVYSASGEILSYINKSLLFHWLARARKAADLQFRFLACLAVNQSDLTAVDEGSEFILIILVMGNSSTMNSLHIQYPVAPHTSAMVIGKKYYSTDGEHFDGFTIKILSSIKNLRRQVIIVQLNG